MSMAKDLKSPKIRQRKKTDMGSRAAPSITSDSERGA